MDFTIETADGRCYICPYTPRALKRLARWALDDTGFPYPRGATDMLVERLAEEGFEIDDRRAK